MDTFCGPFSVRVNGVGCNNNDEQGKCYSLDLRLGL